MTRSQVGTTYSLITQQGKGDGVVSNKCPEAQGIEVHRMLKTRAKRVSPQEDKLNDDDRTQKWKGQVEYRMDMMCEMI